MPTTWLPLALMAVADGTSNLIEPLWRPHGSTPLHLSISAFMDGDRCATTLQFALENARRPERLSFGVLQARGEKDQDCIRGFEDKRLPALCETLARQHEAYASDCTSAVMSQIRSKVIAPEDAKGPNHQRSLQIELIEFDKMDKMCMQTDSHMDFLQGWDELLMDDWLSKQNEFAVLTAYVMNIDAKEHGYAYNHMVDCCGWFEDEDGMPRGNQCGNIDHIAEPILTPNWAAGFSFHRCHAERNVPIDPNLEWIFTGEEVDRAARLWTSGYDLYLPSRAFVLHNYSHATQRFWRFSRPGEMRQQSEASRLKLSLLLGLGAPRKLTLRNMRHYYPLGQQRSLEQWKEFVKPTYNKDEECHRLGLERVPVRDRDLLEESARHPNAHEL
mmetsp:Transcript_21341/g.59539  ORF Transcript_21341/g.59539 Transcript_21341/m.59539 type:complete len:387 (+) Transcript_21341:101-1261(+)